MENILLGAADAVTPSAIIAVFGGILIGYLVGIVPGLSRPAALAVAVPLTYYMTPVGAIAFLIGVTKASATGGATTAIMLNTPGEPSSAATCYDGYPLARQGKAAKALKIALYASVFGDMLGTIVLIVLAMPLASVALRMGPVELTAVMVFALTFIAALAGKSLSKGLLAGLMGLLFSTVGLDPESATPRMTFGMIELFDGIPLVAATVGMLALSEMIVQAEEYLSTRRRGAVQEKIVMTEEGSRLSMAEVREIAPTTLRSSLIGIGAGIIPGLGPTIGSFLSYAVAKKMARPGDKFGQGDIKGVAATESADNAVLPASFIPLFALGLPGSVSAAILVAAFTMHGVVPGPLIFEEHPRLMYGVYVSMLLASAIMLVVGRMGLTLFARLGDVPATIVIPSVLVFSTLGAYLENHSMFAVYAMIAFGGLGYLMQRYGYSIVTFLIGFLIGPSFELSLRQAMIVTHREPAALLDHPIALAFLVMSVVAVVFFLRPAPTLEKARQSEL